MWKESRKQKQTLERNSEPKVKGLQLQQGKGNKSKNRNQTEKMIWIDLYI